MCRQDDQDSRQAQDECKENERNDGDRFGDYGDDDEVEGEADGGREDEGADQLDEDDELHAEAERAAKVAHKDQFHEVVDGAVDPSSALREEDGELFGDSGLAYRLWNEDLLAFGEGLQHQRREVSIFTKEQQILLMQCVDHIF